MAARLTCSRYFSRHILGSKSSPRLFHPLNPAFRGSRRSLLTSASSSSVPDFAFAFDIDGVLVRGTEALPHAHKTLALLQAHRIPFIFLTNGGGRPESEHVQSFSKRLGVPLPVEMFVQSHTPFAEMGEWKDKTVLVVGGPGEKCREAAFGYGYKNVVIPADIFVAHPEIWPFSEQYLDYYKQFSRPLPQPISKKSEESLKIDAIFVYHDPRDWGLEASLIVDLLLSHRGIFGTLSQLNNREDLPNRGFLQDGQPPVFFSNGDLWWPAKFHLPRLAQAGFREALEGVWAAITGGPSMGVELKKEVFGKPTYNTYFFAEKRLNAHRTNIFQGEELGKLNRVYMVGDNPESDIRGGNTYKSPFGSEWYTILVKTGIYQGGEPAWPPTTHADDVYDAVIWALEHSKWA